MTRSILMVIIAIAGVTPASSQQRFPPESLANVQVFDKTTPVTTVIGTMRNFTGWLGVRCQYCHVGEEGLPLERFNFVSDDKRTKQTARVMMRMVEDINRQLAAIPQRPSPEVAVNCGTCHRGVPRPAPLIDLLTQALAVNADSSVALYRALRERFYGRAAYDFGEVTLNTLAGRLTREGKYDDAMRMVLLNTEFFPTTGSVAFAHGEVLLARRDTTGAVEQYRRAVSMDGNPQAHQRLTSLGAR